MKYQFFLFILITLSSNFIKCQQQNKTEEGRPFIVTFNFEQLYNYLPDHEIYHMLRWEFKECLPKVQLYFQRLLRRSIDLSQMKTYLDSDNYKQPSQGSIPGFDELVQRYYNVPMNSDLHIFLTIEDSFWDFEYIADNQKSRYSIIQKDITTGTIFAELRFRMGTFFYRFRNTYDFQNRSRNLITQNILKILLGNTQIRELWRNSNNEPLTPQNMPILPGKIDGLDVQYITTPLAQQVIRNYHGCQTIPGIPLLIRGDKFELSGQMFQDEILNVNQVDEIDPYLSIFTITLLQSTNMFSFVNTTMADEYFFGKDAGCNFYADKVCQRPEFNQEYCIYDEIYEQGCDYHGYGMASCYVQDGFSNDCFRKVNRVYCKDLIWQSDRYEYQIQITGATPREEGDSKCFTSSLKKMDTQDYVKEGVCHTYFCDLENQYMIVVIEFIKGVDYREIKCTYNGEIISVPNFSGYFYCPKNLNQFCSFKKQCNSQCIFNGFCLKGQCQCLLNYTGEFCDQYTPPPNQ